MSKQDQDARMHSYAEQNAQLDLMYYWVFHIAPFVPLIYYVWYRCHLVPSAFACVRILIPTHPPCMISQMRSQKKNVFFIVSRGWAILCSFLQSGMEECHASTIHDLWTFETEVQESSPFPKWHVCVCTLSMIVLDCEFMHLNRDPTTFTHSGPGWVLSHFGGC